MTLDEVTTNHDDIVQVKNTLGSLYEYTHHVFLEVNKILQEMVSRFETVLKTLIYLIHRDRLRNNLYTDITT